MIKLQSAICPQCGANIEVNEKLEKTICQYCGTTILVDDAVEKYKLEISGKVKVSGIKDRDDFLEEAKKHYKVGEYYEAKECLKNIIEKDSFDIEAYSELIKNDIALLRQNNYEPYISKGTKGYDRNLQEVFCEIGECFNRVTKIDENDEVKKYLKDDYDKASEYSKLGDKITDIEVRLEDLTKKMNKLLQDAEFGRWEDTLYKEVSKCFLLSGNIERSSYSSAGDYRKDSYMLNKFDRISIDGKVYVNYERVSEQYPADNPYNVVLYNEPKTYAKTPEEMEQRINKFEQNIDEMVNEGTKKGNKVLGKERKKTALVWTYRIVKLVISVGLLIYLFKFFGKQDGVSDEDAIDNFWIACGIAIIPIIIIIRTIKKIKDDIF